MLTCLLTRRRLDALVDGALDERRKTSATAHVSGCDRCRREVDELQRLRSLVRRSLGVAAPSDWSGFWAGVARGIEDHREALPVRRPRLELGRFLPGHRLAYGAAAAVVLVSVAVWQFWGGPAEPPIFIWSANTEMPGASLMVYAPPERDLAVVWVMASDDDQ